MIAAIFARKSMDRNGVADEQKSVARQVAHAQHHAERAVDSITPRDAGGDR